MNRIDNAERQRQRILNALANGPRTMYEIEHILDKTRRPNDQQLSRQRLSQYLIRMTKTEEISRSGNPYLYTALVRYTVPAASIRAIFAANVNGGEKPQLVRPNHVTRTAARVRPVVRLFGGLDVSA